MQWIIPPPLLSDHRDRWHGVQDVEGFHSGHSAAGSLSSPTRQTWAPGLVGERRSAGAHRGQSVPGRPGSDLQSHRGRRLGHLHLRGPEQGGAKDTGGHLYCGQWVIRRQFSIKFALASARSKTPGKLFSNVEERLYLVWDFKWKGSMWFERRLWLYSFLFKSPN